MSYILAAKIVISLLLARFRRDAYAFTATAKISTNLEGSFIAVAVVTLRGTRRLIKTSCAARYRVTLSASIYPRLSMTSSA